MYACVYVFVFHTNLQFGRNKEYELMKKSYKYCIDNGTCTFIRLNMTM